MNREALFLMMFLSCMLLGISAVVAYCLMFVHITTRDAAILQACLTAGFVISFGGFLIVLVRG